MLEIIVGAISSCAETVSLLILALGLGFGVLPSAAAFLTAATGMLVFNQVVPMSIMSEQLILLDNMTKDRRERQTVILCAGLLTAVLGFCGVIEFLRKFIGETILSAMMAGVGVLLAKVSLDMVRKDRIPGLISLVTAVIVYQLTRSLIYTVAGCVAVTALVYNLFLRKRRPTGRVSAGNERFAPLKPKMNGTVLRGILAMSALMLGEVIADASLSCSIAGWPYEGDHIAVYTGIANAASGFFGGVPVGPIISGTAAASRPVLCGVLMMVFMAVIVLLKLVPKVAPYVPSTGVAGFIFVVAIFVVFPDNAVAALSAAPLVAGITIAVTAFIDPFFGMCAGVAAKYLFVLLGMLS